jgi:hypothetical protein
MPRWLWGALFFCLSLMMMGNAAAQTTPTITFSSTETINQFPTSLTFRATVTIDPGQIIRARLRLRNSNLISIASSTTVVDVPITPGQTVNLAYTWAITTAPSTPFYYVWELTDSAGNIIRSPEALIYYHDTRYEWQILENQYLAVWWHDRPASFGDQVFEIANRAFTAQQDLFGTPLEFPIKIIIYNNFTEFAEWQGGLVEFIGGQAFPNIGVTTQIVEAFGSQTRWLNEVIPHEISHLYLAQVSYNPTARVPVWLDEGVAQYNEFTDPAPTLALVRRAAANGTLIPLSTLRDGFGMQSNEERSRLAYAQALTAVTYLIETYGTEGLADLLAAYKAGISTEDAFLLALGVTLGEFEAGWAVWLGLPPRQYVTPTPWPLPTFRPSPTLMSFATRTPTTESGITAATATPSPIPLATTPAPTALAQITVVVQTPTPGSTPTRSDTSGRDSPSTGFCPGAFLLLPLLLVYRSRRNPKPQKTATL